MRRRATRESAVTEFNLLGEDGSSPGYSKGRTITHGSLKRGLWKVSWPILVTSGCLSIVDLVHVQCAGTLSGSSQAIIGVCDQMMLMCFIVITSLATAGTALVSNAYGGRNSKDVVAITQQMLWLMVALALIMSLSLLMLSEALVSSFSGCVSNCDATISDGKCYLKVVAFALVPCAFVSTINAAFLGISNARIQLMTLTVMAIVDMIVCYLLVIKEWPISGLGIAGIGYASITGYGVAAVLAIVAWCRSEIRTKSKIGTRPDVSRTQFIRPLLVSGVPMAIQDIAWCSSTFVLFWILSLLKQPAEAVAAWTIGQRLEAFALLPLGALSMAVLVGVGQNFGSARVDRAWRAVTDMTKLATALLVSAGIMLFLFAEPLARGATSDETTRSILVWYLRLAAFGLPFAGLESVLGGSLQAMNDSRVPMVLSFVSNWGLGLSLTFLLAITLGHGAPGAWFAMVATTVVIGLLTSARFLTRPHWKALSPVSAKRPNVESGPPPPEVSSLKEHEAAKPDEAISRGKQVRELDLPKEAMDGEL